MYLFFDTETTGLPDKRKPLDDSSQPHICQLAAIETDADGKVMTEINFLIAPDGWSIPEQASAIHGITQADAETYGVRMAGVINIMQRLIRRSELLIAHNIEFDAWMLRREMAAGSGSPCPWGGRKEFCTMAAATDVVQCPPTERMLAKGMTGFKRPSLTEAYRHFFGQDFDGAHNAMADVRACRDIFFALRKHGATPALAEVAA